MSRAFAIDSLEHRTFLSAAKPSPMLGSISGSVFSDLNLNAAHDAGEAGAKGVYIFLDLNGNGTYEKKTEPFAKTDKRGAFAFNGLKAGTYRVRELVSQGSTMQIMTTTAVSTPASGYFKINLAAGQNIIHRQFGTVTLFEPNSSPASAPSASVRLSNSPRAGAADLTDNDALFHSPANGAAQDLPLFIRSSRASGGWTSSAATSNSSSTGLGVITGLDYKTIVWQPGLSGAATDIVAKYTYAGDADLTGKVDGADYSRIDLPNPIIRSNNTGWFNGDFDYGGTITGGTVPAGTVKAPDQTGIIIFH